jgi:hypothetical protein
MWPLPSELHLRMRLYTRTRTRTREGGDALTHDLAYKIARPLYFQPPRCCWVEFLDPAPQFWRVAHVYRFVLTRSFFKGAATVGSDGYVFISPMQRPLHSIPLRHSYLRLVIDAQVPGVYRLYFGLRRRCFMHRFGQIWQMCHSHLLEKRENTG